MPAHAEDDSNTRGLLSATAAETKPDSRLNAGMPFATFPGMNTQDHSSCRGFSLVELLIVAAVIGLIAAIAIPNLVNAIQRGRQSRTVGDLRGIATAVAMYQQDYSKYPVAADNTDAADLRPHLASYMENFNANDGWQRPFRYTSDGDHYTLVSYALNGVADTPWVQGETNYFDDDIVIVDGSYLQVPAGTQE